MSESENDFEIEKVGRIQLQSAWVDVENKAKVMMNTGRVTLHHKRPYDLNKPSDLIEVSGTIAGDHGRYNAKIVLPHPRSRAVRTWSCGCTWSRYVFDRRPIYKVDRDGRRREVNRKFEGRVCSHVLALWWMSLKVPVEYEDVDVDVLRQNLPQMAEQGRLFDSDVYEIGQEQSKDEIARGRISPGLMESLYGVDINVINQSIQQAFELATGDEVTQDLEDAVRQWAQSGDPAVLERLLSEKNVYDTDQSVEYKKVILDKIITLVEAEARLAQEPNAPGSEQLRIQVSQTRKEISARARMLQELYTSNIDAAAVPRMKAEDVVEQFHWWENYDAARGRKFLQEFLNTKDPKIIKDMINARIVAQQEIDAVGGGQQQLRMTNVREASVSFIASDTPVKDIINYLQKELAEARDLRAYVRKELWGEQRGGLHPHPDAQPISVRPDGNFVYSLDDLGYHPEHGEMGHDLEERGTYGAVPVGGEVRILGVDPKNRLVKVEYVLGNDQPNHQHIHLWVSLKDIDLI